jgi:hypothetical protein
MGKPLAFIGLDEPGGDSEKRGFPRAIPTDEANAVAGRDCQFGSAEQWQAAKGKVNVFERQKGRRHWNLRACWSGESGRLFSAIAASGANTASMAFLLLPRLRGCGPCNTLRRLSTATHKGHAYGPIALR